MPQLLIPAKLDSTSPTTPVLLFLRPISDAPTVAPPLLESSLAALAQPESTSVFGDNVLPYQAPTLTVLTDQPQLLEYLPALLAETATF